MRSRNVLRAVAVALVASLIPALVAAAAAPAWSARLVDQLRARGLLVGKAPADGPITRAEAARLLVGALGLSYDAADLRLQPSRFYDVPVGEAASYIETAAELGLLRGYGDGTYGPDAPLSRAQLVTVLVRAMGWETRARAAASDSLPFRDSAAIPRWARGYVAVAAKENLVKGFEDGTFRPDQSTARGDAAALIARFMEGRGSLIQREGILDQRMGSKGQFSLNGEWLVLAPDASVYRNGEAVSASPLMKGERVRVILDDQGRATYLEVAIPSYSGVLSSVNAQTRQVRLTQDDGRQVELVLGPGARVFRNGRPAEASGLLPGDEVFVLVDGSGLVTGLDATHTDFEGVLVEVRLGGRPRLVAVHAGGTFLEAPVDPDSVVYINNRKAQLGDLRPSDQVRLTRDESGTVTYVEAER